MLVESHRHVGASIPIKIDTFWWFKNACSLTIFDG